MASGGGRFTIRQIYHLTELRRSGLTKEQIMLGLDEIECLKNETADLSFSNIIEPPKPPTPPIQAPATNEHVSTTTSNEKPKKIGGKKRSYQQLLAELKAADSSSSTSNPPAARVPRMSRMTTPASLPAAPKTCDPGSSTPAGCLVVGGRRGSKKDGQSIPMQNMGKSVSWAEVEDLDPIVRDLLGRDVCSVRDELQEFITEYRIRQASIVRESNSRLSQPYLSTWLNTPHSKNFRKVRVLYEWYVEAQRRVKRDGGFIPLKQVQKQASEMQEQLSSLRSLNRPSITPRADEDNDHSKLKQHQVSSSTSVSTTHVQQRQEKQPTATVDNQTPSTPSPIPASTDLWPTVCEDFLEEAFTENLHPNYSARKVIAERCTQLISEAQERHGIVMGKTPQTVTANQVCVWYINRRKEQSRRNSFDVQSSAESSPRIYPILSASSFRSVSPDENNKSPTL